MDFRIYLILTLFGVFNLMVEVIMDKKLLAIFVIAVFLITSVGAISATDSISVKVIWDGNSVPDSVTVNLIKDGNVVDSAKLNKSNSWNTTFKVDDDGSYQVKEVVPDNYTYTVSRNADSGFVISNKFVKTVNVLTATGNNSVVKDSANSTVSQESGDVIKVNDTQNVVNASESSDANVTEENNETEDTTAATDDKPGNVTETVTTTTTEHEILKIIEHYDKQPSNPTKVNLNTGFPVAILVCAVFVAAFIPFTRKK